MHNRIKIRITVNFLISGCCFYCLRYSSSIFQRISWYYLTSTACARTLYTLHNSIIHRVFTCTQEDDFWGGMTLEITYSGIMSPLRILERNKCIQSNRIFCHVVPFLQPSRIYLCISLTWLDIPPCQDEF